MKWKKEKIDAGEVREIAKQYKVNLIAASILVRRGITSQKEIKYILENSIEFLHNPFLFSNMEEAVDRINAAIEGDEKIKIFGDRDVDGITSTVILYETLKKMGGDVSCLLPEGENDYGLSKDIISQIAEEGTELLITVDCGITSTEEISLASKNGIDTIIVDHHNEQGKLPGAVAIINPKVKGCRYPFRELSGCGVVSKLVWALYFSNSSFYGSSVSLVNVKPANDSYIVEAVKMHNLVRTDKMIENIVPGITNYEKTRLDDFLKGDDILVLNTDEQLRTFKRIFGEDFDIELNDLQPYIDELLPEFSNMSLLRIKEARKYSRYSEELKDEIDVLADLFVSLVIEKEKTLLKEYAEILDLVALGTLADLMPLVDENRILVKKGMEALNSTNRYWLRELLTRQNINAKRLRTNDIAWQISPVLNAAGRMGEPEAALQLLLTDSEEKAAEFSDRVFELNKKRKAESADAWNKVTKQAKNSLEKTGGKFILAYAPSINRGVTGIVASRLASSFRVPVIVTTRVEDRVVGSLRSRANFSIKDFLNGFSKLLSNFGGHDFAAGFSMPYENFETFEKMFYERVEEIDVPEQTETELYIDAEIPPDYLQPNIKDIVDLFEPFGEKNPPLNFLTRGIILKSYELMGKKEAVHVRMLFDTGKYKWPAVYWNGAEDIKGISPGDAVDIIYRITTNYYQSMENTQLSIIQISK